MATPVTSRSATRAERMVQREYEELRAPTLRALRGRLGRDGIRFDDADLDAFYNQAWHGLYERLVQGDEVENRGGFLVVAAHRRAIEELRRLHPERRADGIDAVEAGHEVDLAQRLDDRRRVVSAMEGMRERLSERERQAAALCYLHGYSRPQAAAALGVAPKRMEKLMDGVSRKLGTLASEIDDGDWCESRQSLMKAYAFGVLDPAGERYAIARGHLDECPRCRSYVRSLRGIAAVVPPAWLPVAALAALGIGGAGAAAAGGAGAGGTGGAGGAGAAGSAGSGFGAAGAAVAATAVVAAAGLGAWAVASHDGGGSGPSGGRTAPASAPAPATAPPAATAKASSARASARRATARRRARARAAAKTSSAPVAAPPSAAAPAPAPAAPIPPPVTTTNTPAPTAPAAKQDQGSSPEFGFER